MLYHLALSSFQTVPNGLVKLSQYEVINFKGWFGLLLAVQQSPVVVNIEASEDSFVNYIPVRRERVDFLAFFRICINSAIGHASFFINGDKIFCDETVN